jgi:hypothetical protein
MDFSGEGVIAGDDGSGWYGRKVRSNTRSKRYPKGSYKPTSKPIVAMLIKLGMSASKARKLASAEQKIKNRDTLSTIKKAIMLEQGIKLKARKGKKKVGKKVGKKSVTVPQLKKRFAKLKPSGAVKKAGIKAYLARYGFF